MPTAPPLHNDYYVYALLREDGATPFYVGKGRGQRIFVHEKQASRGTSHKDRIIQNMLSAGLSEVPKIKIAENLSDSAAKVLEVALIERIGRWPEGPLANLTDGGDGVANLSTEARKRKSARNVLSWADPSVKSKRIQGMKAVWTAEKKKQLGLDKREKLGPKLITQLDAMRQFWNNPEQKAAAIAKRNATLAEKGIRPGPKPRQKALVFPTPQHPSIPE